MPRLSRPSWLVLCVALAACMQRPPAPSYVLFFTSLSSTLSDEAALVVKEAAFAARDTRARQVIVSGYVDNAGSPAADVALSLARAQHVSDELVRNGVELSRIKLEPEGSAGDPGVVSRRVEIDIVP